jgi:putative membrane protein
VNRSWSPRARVRRALSEGSDPDPRFTFANERTLLAWIRTALALLAGGLGLEAFAGDALPVVLRQVLASLLLGLGAAVALVAPVRWLRSETALRRGESLPALAVAPVLAAGIAACGVALLAGVLARA